VDKLVEIVKTSNDRGSVADAATKLIEISKTQREKKSR